MSRTSLSFVGPRLQWRKSSEGVKDLTGKKTVWGFRKCPPGDYSSSQRTVRLLEGGSLCPQRHQCSITLTRSTEPWGPVLPNRPTYTHDPYRGVERSWAPSVKGFLRVGAQTPTTLGVGLFPRHETGDSRREGGLHGFRGEPRIQGSGDVR